MKKILIVSAVLLTFCGCKSTPSTVNYVAPGVSNEVRVANIYSEFSDAITDYRKTCKVAVDGTEAPENYNSEVKAYTENALRYVGYTVVGEDSKAEIVVSCKYHVVHNHRMATYYELTAREGDKIIWRVQTSCGSAIRPFRPFLPGLAAAAIPYIGKNKGRHVLNLKKYPQYLTAVMGNSEQ